MLLTKPKTPPEAFPRDSFDSRNKNNTNDCTMSDLSSTEKHATGGDTASLLKKLSPEVREYIRRLVYQGTDGVLTLVRSQIMLTSQ
jgi:hypothetical protein